MSNDTSSSKDVKIAKSFFERLWEFKEVIERSSPKDLEDPAWLLKFAEAAFDLNRAAIHQYNAVTYDSVNGSRQKKIQ